MYKLMKCFVSFSEITKPIGTIFHVESVSKWDSDQALLTKVDGIQIDVENLHCIQHQGGSSTSFIQMIISG